MNGSLFSDEISAVMRACARVCQQGALKGTNLRGQTEPKRRFSQIFADSRLFLENKAFGKRRFSQKTLIFAGNRRKPKEPAENRRLACVPLGSSPQALSYSRRMSEFSAPSHSLAMMICSDLSGPMSRDTRQCSCCTPCH